MRKFNRLSFPVLFLFLGLACFAEPATSNSAGDTVKATVYVYRFKQFTGSALSPLVYCDEVQLARLDNGRYFAAKIVPGRHVFHSNDKQSGVELDIKPAQKYFIRVEIAAGFMKGHGRLVLMPAEQGSYELQSSKLKPLDRDKVDDPSRVSIEQAHVNLESNAVATDTSRDREKIVNNWPRIGLVGRSCVKLGDEEAKVLRFPLSHFQSHRGPLLLENVRDKFSSLSLQPISALRASVGY